MTTEAIPGATERPLQPTIGRDEGGSAKSGDDIWDEISALYEAMTRAEQLAFMDYARRIRDGRAGTQAVERRRFRRDVKQYQELLDYRAKLTEAQP